MPLRTRAQQWGHRNAALACVALASLAQLISVKALEEIETKVDRDGDVLVIEDILEGFGSVPVSVELSPVSDHMFIGFKGGEVRIYPDGGETEQAAVFDPCVSIEEDVYANNDLGLLNFRLHPDWPDTAYGYMLYAHDEGYEDDCLIEPPWCEKDHRFVRVEVEYDASTGAVTCGAQDILISDWCTGSNHHGGGGMAFLSNGDMALSVGDMSKADQRDPGDEEENTCFREDVEIPQGNFRAQRDDFNEGKLLHISAEALLKAMPTEQDVEVGFLVRDEDFSLKAKGFRNPFRIAIAPETGDIVVADVGLDTLESLKVVPNPLTAATSTSLPNHGWPCMEGDAWIPPYTNEWLVQNENDICDGVRDTTLGLPLEVDYDALKTKAEAGTVDWVPPAFTYRSETIDEEYPDMCTSVQASVSSVHFYEGNHLPERYKNALFVGDYSKNCVFYFDTNDKSGDVDWTTPHVLFEGRSIVDFNTDPKTGILYAIDAQYSILIRISAIGGPISSVGPTVVLEADVVSGAVPLEVTLDASNSSDATGIVSLNWDCDGDGVYEDSSDWSVATQRTHVCTYTVDGVYDATVEAVNAGNGSTVESVSITAGDAEAETFAPTPTPSASATDAPLPTPAPVAPPLGEALSSPPDLQWEFDVAIGVFSAELEFGVVTMDNFWGSTVTRGFNGMIPGPTIRMEACQTYHLTLANAMEEPNPGGEWNTMKDPNTTNVHTHGLHISGQSPADDVLYVKVEPGETHIYEYTIPCDHAGGTFWYHPHHHGSTSLQMGGGAMGVLIIKDQGDVHGIPDQYADMPELILAVQELVPAETTKDSAATGDTLYTTTATSRHYLVSGEVLPSIELTSGVWTRFRMAFAGHGNSHAISFLDPDGNCEMAVLAKDGVYLSEVPREEAKLFFTAASRVDAAVRCSAAGEYDLGIESTISLGETTALAVLSVQANTGPDDDALETWNPCRPYYLEDLTTYNFTQSDTVGLLVRETIGGEPFKGPGDVLLNMTANEVQQWNLQGSEQHPFHLHVNHMQFVEVDGPLLVPGWNHVGDWIDTVSTSLAVVRFRTERFGGHVMMHCHVNSHSDTGVMAQAMIYGGEDANEDSAALAPGTCGTDGIVGYGYNLSPDGTPSPSTGSGSSEAPTTTPSPANADTGAGSTETGSTETEGYQEADHSWWIAAAVGAGVGFAVLSLGALIFFKCGGKYMRRGADVRDAKRNGPISSGSSHDLMAETKQEPA